MFNFKKFPAKLKHEQWNDQDEVILEREVEVFGYTCDYELIAYRNLDSIDRDVFLLPVKEFEERFKDYELVEEE